MIRSASKTAVAVLLGVSLIGAGACTRTQQYVGTGAAVGAVTGGVIGAATGGSTLGGAVIGGVGGAGVGYLLSRHNY